MRSIVLQQGDRVSRLRAPEWDREGADWPNRDASRFVEAAGLRWHVQDAGRGPVCLLIHGTGASTHSFRDLLPKLTPFFRVIAPDLPGHGFTSRPSDDQGLSLQGMVEGLAQLLTALGVSPQLVVGHSAGAAILCRACLDGRMHPAEIISLNGALLPLSGFKHPAVTPFIRAIASSDWVSRFFARRFESPAEVNRLLAATGSTLDAAGMAFYGRLSRSPSHAGAALTMMAVWDVRPLERELSKLSIPLTLVVGARDRMILPGEAARVQRLLPSAEVVQFPDQGHLLHEERPDFIADLIVSRARSRGVLIPS
jgi:magnesium chelatase accessory protein